MGLIARGLAAGAAGTTALNAVTYIDMAIRGRGTSDSPQQLVENAANRAGVDVPGSKDERQNRLNGLCPLAGSAVGVLVGAATGLVDRMTAGKLPEPILAVLVGAAAMCSPMCHSGCWTSAIHGTGRRWTGCPMPSRTWLTAW